jgi:hypothetical protein
VELCHGAFGGSSSVEGPPAARSAPLSPVTGTDSSRGRAAPSGQTN